MNFSEQQRSDVDKAIVNVRSLSRLLEEKLGVNPNEKGISYNCNNSAGFVSNLSDSEATDLGYIASYTEYLILKYKEKKDMKEFLETFLNTISGISGSITPLEDKLVEMVISAENAHKQLKDAHSEFTSTVILQKRGQKSMDDFVGDPQKARRGNGQRAAQNENDNLLTEGAERENSTQDCSTIFTNTSSPVYTNEYVTEPSLEYSQSS